MKVAIVYPGGVIPPDRGSLEILIWNVAKRLKEYVHIAIFCSGKKRQKLREMVDGIEIFRTPKILRIVDKFIEFVFKFIFHNDQYVYSQYCYIATILYMAICLRRRQFDVIHIFTFSQHLPWLKSFNPKSKIIINFNHIRFVDIDTKILNRRLQYADLIVGVCEFVTNRIRYKYSEYRDRCFTSLNGVDIQKFYPYNGYEKHHKGSKIVLYVGRIVPEKGVHLLIEAIKMVVSKYKYVKLVIMGEFKPFPAYPRCAHFPFMKEIGSLNHGYEQFIKSKVKEVQKYVELKEAMLYENMPDIYNMADIFVHPAYIDIMPKTVLEAMACGLPVIASKTGGLPEMVLDGTTGILVPPGDAKLLADAIIKLLANDDLRITMGKRARKRVESNFTWEHVADRFLNLYSETL